MLVLAIRAALVAALLGMLVVVFALGSAMVVPTEDAHRHVDTYPDKEDNRDAAKPRFDAVHLTSHLTDTGHPLAEQDREDHHEQGVSQAEEHRHQPAPAHGLHHREWNEGAEIEQSAIRAEREGKNSA